jgi:hypothetical protein
MLLSPLKVFVYLFIALSANPSTNIPQSLAKKSIRKVNFGNFRYPKTKGLSEPHSRKRSIRLINGSSPESRDKQRNFTGNGIFLSKVSYGDVTGEGQEEAIVVLGFLTGGSGMPNCVYVYTLNHQRLRLLWAFDTGDRAYGGLRRVTAENGRLLVELYGNGKIIGKDLEAEDKSSRGACCPSLFTRARYRWTGNGFRLASKPKVLPNREVSGSFINDDKYGVLEKC